MHLLLLAVTVDGEQSIQLKKGLDVDHLRIEGRYLQRFTYANKDGITALSTINMLRNDLSNKIPLNYVMNIYIKWNLLK